MSTFTRLDLSPASSVQELDGWTKKHYPGAMQTHYWSAQDYTPADELPYVGPILPGTDKISWQRVSTSGA